MTANLPGPRPIARQRPRRWFSPAPVQFIAALLMLETFLWLSGHFRWFAFNEHKGWTVLIAFATIAAGSVVLLVWFAVGLIFRLRFRFRIRSLLALTLALALVCSWMAVEIKKARCQRQTVEAIKADGWVFYDYQREDSQTATEPRGPVWLRRLLGDDFFNDVWQVGLEADPPMRDLKGLAQAQIADSLERRNHRSWLTTPGRATTTYVAGVQQRQRHQ